MSTSCLSIKNTKLPQKCFGRERLSSALCDAGVCATVGVPDHVDRSPGSLRQRGAPVDEGRVEPLVVEEREGVVAHLTLEVDGSLALAEAHAQASRVEERIRREQPDIDDLIVHTEP